MNASSTLFIGHVATVRSLFIILNLLSIRRRI